MLRRTLATLAATAVTAALLIAPTSGDASFAAAQAGQRKTSWTAAGKATITPGVMMYTRGAQCTANFVYTDKRGGVYVGYAAHCAGKGEATDTDGCSTTSHPIGTKVTFVRGGSLVSGGTVVGTGKLAYSSWITMRRIGTKDPQACAYNDLALVKVDRKDVKKVNPSVPVFGGPVGLSTAKLSLGDRVYSYGNSSIRGGAEPLSPKYGVALGDDPADQGWSHPLYSLTPGIPGDSGSGFLTANGRAIGTLSTVVIAPTPGSNNIGDLAKELRFAQRHSGIAALQLTRGTVKFAPPA